MMPQMLERGGDGSGGSSSRFFVIARGVRVKPPHSHLRHQGAPLVSSTVLPFLLLLLLHLSWTRSQDNDCPREEKTNPHSSEDTMYGWQRTKKIGAKFTKFFAFFAEYLGGKSLAKQFSKFLGNGKVSNFKIFWCTLSLVNL